MGNRIRVCGDWETSHDRPRYTLGDTCPSCGTPTRPAAPARFSPEDRYGHYRRALRDREGG